MSVRITPSATGNRGGVPVPARNAPFGADQPHRIKYKKLVRSQGRCRAGPPPGPQGFLRTATAQG